MSGDKKIVFSNQWLFDFYIPPTAFLQAMIGIFHLTFHDQLLIPICFAKAGQFPKVLPIALSKIFKIRPIVNLSCRRFILQ